MQPHQATPHTPLQIPGQPAQPRSSHIQTLPAPGMALPQPAASAGPGQVCWCLDARVLVVLGTLAGALILLLLYRLLVLRHRLARCRPALQYHSFYHTARYTLKDPGLSYTLPDTGGIPKDPGLPCTLPDISDNPKDLGLPLTLPVTSDSLKDPWLPLTLPGTSATLKDPGLSLSLPVTSNSLMDTEPPLTLPGISATQKDPGLPLTLPVTGLDDPGLPLTLPASVSAPEVSPEEPPPPKLPLPSAPLHPPLLPLPPVPLTLPPPFTPPLGLTPPLPIIHTTPPSPPLSWGACSDMEVYSRIGAFRPSRPSSLRHIQVILFEHSSL